MILQQKIAEKFVELEESIYKQYELFHNPRLTPKQRENLGLNLERKLFNFYDKFDEYIRKNAIFQFDLSGSLMAIYMQADDACDEYNIKKSGLSHCLNGKLKSYKGYVWKKGLKNMKN